MNLKNVKIIYKVIFFLLTPFYSSDASPVKLETKFHLRYQYQVEEFAEWIPKEQDDNGFQLIRYYFDVDLKHQNGFRVFSQLISAHEAGRRLGPRKRDEDDLDFQQLYVELPIFKHKLKLGRQSLRFGKERMVGTLNGPNYKPFFDGLLLTSQFLNFKSQLFRMHRIDIDSDTFNNQSDKDWVLQGHYLTYERKKDQLDLYFMQLRGLGLTNNFNWKDREENTIGLRYESKIQKLKYDFEGAYQFADELRAFAVMSQIDYEIADHTSAIMDVHYYSGDEQPRDSLRKTFRVPYPKGANFGESGLLSPANVFFIKSSLKTELAHQINLKLSYAYIWKSEKEDAIFSMRGRPLMTNPSKSRNLGQQFDLHVYKTFSEKLTTHLQSSIYWVDSRQQDVVNRLKKVVKLFCIYRF